MGLCAAGRTRRARQGLTAAWASRPCRRGEGAGARLARTPRRQCADRARPPGFASAARPRPCSPRPTRTISPISWPRCRARRRSRRSASARTSSCATAASRASSSGSAAGRSARSRSWTAVASSPGRPTPDQFVAKAAAKAGVDGLAFLRGVPGSIGGALVMNAGAHGGEVKDVLIEARGVDRTGARRVFSDAEMGFSYRHSSAPDDVVFTAAAFQGRPGEPAAIEAEMERITRAREASQPIREKTGGSTFKNPPGMKAWELIDKAGCRGLRLGDAEVSTMHCNFLINRGAGDRRRSRSARRGGQTPGARDERGCARMGDQARRRRAGRLERESPMRRTTTAFKVGALCATSARPLAPTAIPVDRCSIQFIQKSIQGLVMAGLDPAHPCVAALFCEHVS